VYVYIVVGLCKLLCCIICDSLLYIRCMAEFVNRINLSWKGTSL
jgi:hypothetical protein